MKKNLTSVTKKSGIFFLGKVFTVFFGLLFNYFVVKLYGAKVYGSYVHVITLLNFFIAISTFGFHQGLVYFLPKMTIENKIKSKNDIIKFAFITGFFLALIFSIVIVFNSHFISKNILNNTSLNKYLKAMAYLLFLFVFIRISKGVFRGLNSIKEYVISYFFIIPIIKIIFLIVFFYLNIKYLGVILSVYLSFFIGSIFLIFKMSGHNIFDNLKIKINKDYTALIKYSLPLMFSGILSLLIAKTDIMMIGYFLKEENVGIYNICYKLATLGIFVLASFNTMFAPLISKLYHENKIGELENLYKKITKWIFTINLFIFSVFLLFGSDILRIFGTQFVIGASSLIIITLGQVVNASVGSAGYMNAMTGNPRYNLYTTVLTLIINVILNYLLIPVYGIYGAAMASLVSFSLVNILKLLFLYKELKIHPYYFDFVKVIVTISSGFILIFLLKYYLNIFWMINLIFLISINGILYYFFCMGEEDYMIIDAFKKKFFGIN